MWFFVEKQSMKLTMFGWLSRERILISRLMLFCRSFSVSLAFS